MVLYCIVSLTEHMSKSEAMILLLVKTFVFYSPTVTSVNYKLFAVAFCYGQICDEYKRVLHVTLRILGYIQLMALIGDISDKPSLNRIIYFQLFSSHILNTGAQAYKLSIPKQIGNLGNRFFSFFAIR